MLIIFAFIITFHAYIIRCKIKKNDKLNLQQLSLNDRITIFSSFSFISYMYFLLDETVTYIFNKCTYSVF